jgi:hypothetical protein
LACLTQTVSRRFRSTTRKIARCGREWCRGRRAWIQTMTQLIEMGANADALTLFLQW